jgi:hypothetical protein
MLESTLEKMELERMLLSALDPATVTPATLKAPVLAPAAVPLPTKVSVELVMFTPLFGFPMFPVPLAVVPIRLPSTLMPEMTLPAPAVVPPTVLLLLRMETPEEALQRSSESDGSSRWMWSSCCSKFAPFVLMVALHHVYLA